MIFNVGDFAKVNSGKIDGLLGEDGEYIRMLNEVFYNQVVVIERVYCDNDLAGVYGYKASLVVDKDWCYFFHPEELDSTSVPITGVVINVGDSVCEIDDLCDGVGSESIGLVIEVDRSEDLVVVNHGAMGVIRYSSGDLVLCG